MTQRFKVEIVRQLREEGYSAHNTAELEERLNSRASEGWICVHIGDAPTGWLLVYESQKAHVDDRS